MLLDIRMPEVEWMTVLEKIKNTPHLKQMPIIMLTTTDDPREVERCHQLGCNIYVTKPVSFKDFSETLRRLGLFLLELSRIGRVVREPVTVSFQELVGQALNAVAGHITQQKVDVRVGNDDVMLHGDPVRLAEIWQNLVENAIKYMGDQPFPRIEIGAERRGKDLVFFVRDNGLGIDPGDQTKIFGLFEKLNAGIEGAGLGLARVKRIVEIYGGRVWVASEGPGKGSCFWFTLPVCERL